MRPCRAIGWLLLSVSLASIIQLFGQDCFNSGRDPLEICLDSNGAHTLTAAEVETIAGSNSSRPGASSVQITPDHFGVCDVGFQRVQVQIRAPSGITSTCSGVVRVLPRPGLPQTLYVDWRYSGQCGSVSSSMDPDTLPHWIGYDAFSNIQQAIDQAIPGACIYVSPGTYIENIVISKPLKLFGPNHGLAGGSALRGPEARIFPARSDPENSPIISVEADQITIDGFELDGGNPSLPGGYRAPGTRLHAAAGIQNGVYPNLADVEKIEIRNNHIRNISYDGICLDRYLDFGTPSEWNFIENNQLTCMWEGVLTYAVDAVIAGNVISNVTQGLGVHCVTTPSPPGFAPQVVSNILSIAHWWPVEIEVARAPGIWINYRREDAAPMRVHANVVTTPVAAPSSKTIIGFYSLTVDKQAKVDFRDNFLNGAGNCGIGLLAANCTGSVNLSGGWFRGVGAVGVLAETLDSKWGPGDALVTLTNLEIELSPAAAGAAAIQDSTTPANRAALELLGAVRIHGGAQGLRVIGEKASAVLTGLGQVISDNELGIEVQRGRALLEGTLFTNNRAAAISAKENGIVDAGDCAGLDITGLGRGSGPNGASAGLNDFSDSTAHLGAAWAILNSGTVPVAADHNLFRPSSIQSVESAMFGPVRFSDQLSAAAPPVIAVECLRSIPPPHRTVDEFVAGGGAILAGSATLLTANDLIQTNRAGTYQITRTYTLSGGCAPPVQVQQTLIARDERAPVLQCSGNIVCGVDPDCDFATVTFTNVAADACGELLGTWKPVSTGRFGVGTNRVIVIATDLANNSTACSFDVAVIPPPRITLHPASRTNAVGSTAVFSAAAASPAPMTFAWNKNGIRLTASPVVTGVNTPELTIKSVMDTDAGDYSVVVSNLAGAVSSRSARLVIPAKPGSLRILEVSPGLVKLEARGPAGSRVAVSTSTDLRQWVGLLTNAVPFVLVHTNLPEPRCRFYRGLPIPSP